MSPNYSICPISGWEIYSILFFISKYFIHQFLDHKFHTSLKLQGPTGIGPAQFAHRGSPYAQPKEGALPPHLLEKLLLLKAFDPNKVFILQIFWKMDLKTETPFPCASSFLFVCMSTAYKRKSNLYFKIADWDPLFG